MHIELSLDNISEAIGEYVKRFGYELDAALPVRYFVFDEDGEPFEVDRIVARIALEFLNKPEEQKEEGDA